MIYRLRIHFLFLLIAHPIALWTVWYHFSWAGAASVFVLHLLVTGLGISFGYHRLLTHRALSVPRPIEKVVSVLGLLALQGDPMEWVAIHRQHHKYSDTPSDPHNATAGLWYSHLGWMDTNWTRTCSTRMLARYTPDMLRDPFQVFLHKWHFPIVTAYILACYAVAGWMGICWGVFTRMVVTSNITWTVNSFSHTFGYRSYPTPDGSANCAWSALLNFGEGWQNNHHAFPYSARHGHAWWEFDHIYPLIRLMEKLGLAWDVKLPPPAELEKALPPRNVLELMGVARPSFATTERHEAA